MKAQLTALNMSLILLLAASAMMMASYVDRSYATVAYNILNMVITISLLAVSVTVLAKDRGRGALGRAWVCFTVFVGMWVSAEAVWMLHDLVYHTDPWPSEADVLWLAGYPAYFAFSALYLRPFRKSVSKKLVALSSLVALTMGCSIVAYAASQGSDFADYETILGISYPILDAASVVPILIGIRLFLSGQVSFLWSCLLLGMLGFVAADYGFFFLTLDEEYYSGHPVDIVYIWSYLFFLFGCCNYAAIFKRRTEESRFNDQQKLR